MVNLIFMIRNEIFMIAIRGMKIFYTDRNIKIPQEFIPQTDEEMKEYKMCKNEKELESFVIRDCTKQGAKLIRRDEDK